MADLLIKPLTGAGNTVTIQDQAGGAILTSADSGATLADGVQDNITRLGTVTTGNVDGAISDITTPLANATFPAGHILQVQYSSSSSSVQQSTTNSTRTLCGVTYKELTCRGTGSIYLAQYSCNTGTQSTGSWNGTHQWQEEHSGSWTGWYEASSAAYWYWENGGDRRQPKTWYTWIAPGSNLAVGEKIRFRAMCFSQHSNAAGFDGRKFETFMEVAQ